MSINLPLFSYDVVMCDPPWPWATEAYSLIEALLPDAQRADVFSRQRRPGWDAWGNQTDKFEVAA